MPDPAQFALGVVQRTPVPLSPNGTDLLAKVHYQLSKETYRLTKGRYLVHTCTGNRFD